MKWPISTRFVPFLADFWPISMLLLRQRGLLQDAATGAEGPHAGRGGAVIFDVHSQGGQEMHFDAMKDRFEA